jgi:nucleoid-associated protein YgaU
MNSMTRPLAPLALVFAAVLIAAAVLLIRADRGVEQTVAERSTATESGTDVAAPTGGASLDTEAVAEAPGAGPAAAPQPAQPPASGGAVATAEPELSAQDEQGPRASLPPESSAAELDEEASPAEVASTQTPASEEDEVASAPTVTDADASSAASGGGIATGPDAVATAEPGLSAQGGQEPSASPPPESNATEPDEEMSPAEVASTSAPAAEEDGVAPTLAETEADASTVAGEGGMPTELDEIAGAEPEADDDGELGVAALPAASEDGADTSAAASGAPLVLQPDEAAPEPMADVSGAEATELAPAVGGVRGEPTAQPGVEARAPTAAIAEPPAPASTRPSVTAEATPPVEPSAAPEPIQDLQVSAEAVVEEREALVVSGTAAMPEPAVAPEVSIRAAEAEADTLFVAGEAAPGSLVQVYADGEFVGSASAGEEGNWLVEAEAEVALGEIVLRADVVDASEPSPAAQVELPVFRSADTIVLEPLAAALNRADSSAEATGSLPMPVYVIIRRGDNLWRISRRNYGRGIRYEAIFDANRELIENPDLIFPGQVFVLPEHDRSWDTATN